MATSGYIGKISALVTASTADLSRKLQGATGDVSRFGAQLNRIISGASRSAASSLNDIFTPLQRIQRALEVGSNARLGLVSSSDVERIQRVVSVANEINKPLGAAQRQFSKLSADVQAAFLPALSRAQTQVAGLNDLLERSGTVSARSFEAVASRVDRTTKAIQRLAEVQRLVGTGPRGDELAFTSPRTSGQLQRSAQLRQQAASLPASALQDGEVGGLVRDLARLDALIEKSFANLQSKQLKINVDPSEVKLAENDLMSFQEEARRAADRLSRAIEVRTDTTAIDSLVADINATVEASKRAEQQIASLGQAIARAFAAAPQTIDEAEQELRQLLGEIGKLSAGQQAPFKPITDDLLDLFTAARNGSDNLDEIIQKLQQLKSASREADLTANQGRSSRRASPLAPDYFQRQGAAQVDNRLGPSIGSQTRALDGLIARTAQAKAQIDSLPEGLQARFVPAVQQARNALVQLQNTPKATAAQIRAAAAEVQKLEAGIRRAAAAAALPSFRDFADDFSTRRAVGELQALQQLLVGIGVTAGGPAAQAYERYRSTLQRAIDAGTTGLPSVRRELERLQVEAAKAAANTGKINFSKALQAIQRGGDVARGSFSNLGLAVQQSIFAFDDFISVTGGLDQRIRAAGNNISQLGFILGGTAGLITGVVVSALAQGAVALVNWYFETEKAEEAQKDLEAAISEVNGALEKQAQLTESIANAFRSAASAAADLGSSQQGQTANQRRREVDQIRDEQRQRRTELIAGINPAVSGRRGQISRLQERLEEETNDFERVRIQRQIQRLEQEITAIVDEAEQTSLRTIGNLRRRAARDGVTPQQAFQEEIERVRSRLEGDLESRSRLREDGRETPRLDNSIAQLTRELAKLESALQRLQDDEALGLFTRQQAAADRLQRTQENAAAIEGFTLTAQIGDQLQQQFEAIVGQVADGTIDSVAAEAAARRLEALSQTLDLAGIATRQFYEVLVDSAADLARAVESELESRAGQLRRDANQAESQFGADDARSGVARDLQRQADEFADQAGQRRRDLNAEISAQRLGFERSVLEGTADPQAVAIANEIRRLTELINTEGTDARVQQAAANRIEVLQAQLEAFFESLPNVADLRRRADEGDIQAQGQLRNIEDVIQGQQLLQSPAARAVDEFAERTRQIEAAVDAQQEAILGRAGGRPQDVAAELAELGRQGRDAFDREVDQLFRQGAPAIFNLADSVANAVLQGPSRAALEATDVSTVEGARELNRLIRGDDAGRDQNLVELQEQSRYLQELVELARERGVIPVAN